MIGVYLIKNKVNGKCYVGASKDIEKRFQEHRQVHRHKPDGQILYRAMAKYGLENFEFSILEETLLDDMYEREKYWIDELQSFPHGYNMNEGGVGGGAPGESNGRAILKEKDVIAIRNCYKEGLARKDAYQYFSHYIDYGTFRHIWQGVTWKHIMPEIYTEENRKINALKKPKTVEYAVGQNNGQAKLTNQDVLEIISRLETDNISQTALAKEYNVSYNCINEINRCLRWKHLHDYTRNIRQEYREKGR